MSSDYVPRHLTHLRAAIQCVEMTVFRDDYKKSLLSDQESDLIWQMLGEVYEEDYNDFLSGSEIGKAIIEKDEMKERMQRRARLTLQDSLYEGKVRSIALDEFGYEHQIEANVWGSKIVDDIFTRQEFLIPQRYRNDLESRIGRVLIDKSSLRDWLMSDFGVNKAEIRDLDFVLGEYSRPMRPVVDPLPTNSRGKPGRPSKIKEILAEFERRMIAGVVKPPPRSAEARELATWARQQGLEPPEDGYIGRCIKEKYRSYWAKKGKTA